jgi:glycosyltransferase involved in cell wall biosynthesis
MRGGPRVSIIFPTYNREDLLPRSIESVLSQTYRHIEIIVVDDGSTDDTKRVLEQYHGKLKFLETDHGGPSRARNEGMKRAEGEYIAFLDSDDYYYPDKIRAQVELMELHPEVGMVFTEWVARHPDGTIEQSYMRRYHPTWDCKGWSYGDVFEARGVLGTGEAAVPYFTGNIFRFVIQGTLIPTNTMLFRREVLDEVGLQNESYHLGEDYEFAVRICKKYRVAFIDTPTYVHCLHGQQVNPFVNQGSFDRRKLFLKKIEGSRVLLQAVLDWGRADPDFYPLHRREVDARVSELCRQVLEYWTELGDGAEQRKVLRELYGYEGNLGYFLSRTLLSWAPGGLRRRLAALRHPLRSG